MTRLALLAAALLGAGACSREPASPAGPTRTLRPAGGREVRVPLEVRRIVSTLPGLTESVAYLDGGVSRLVAVSEHCDTPREVLALPKVSVMPLSLEGIAAREPDLVLVDATLLRTSLPDLERRFASVLALESRSLDDLTRTMDLLAEALGTDAARARARSFRERLDAARRLAGTGLPSAPKVLLLGQSEPLIVLGPGSLPDALVRACGAENVASDLDRASGPFAPELVRVRAPDWILLTGEPFPDSLRRAWADVPAVRDGRIADARADDLVRAGPRTPEALLRLSKVLRGELPPERLAGELR